MLNMHTTCTIFENMQTFLEKRNVVNTNCLALYIDVLFQMFMIYAFTKFKVSI